MGRTLLGDSRLYSKLLLPPVCRRLRFFPPFVVLSGCYWPLCLVQPFPQKQCQVCAKEDPQHGADWEVGKEYFCEQRCDLLVMGLQSWFTV